MNTLSPFCVSLGPGEAELITVKALRALNETDIIYCPATKSGEEILSRANDILSQLNIDAQKIKLFFVPMSQERSQAKKVYREVATEIAELSNNGTRVAFVAEGDAGFYSSVHYVSDYLAQKNIAVRHLAGVPAFIACGALAGIHIVKQNERLKVFPSEATPEEIAEALRDNTTVVLMKLSRQEEAIKRAIETLPDAEFHYFENVGVKRKEFYTCDKKEILSRLFPYFSIIIIKNKTT